MSKCITTGCDLSLSPHSDAKIPDTGLQGAPSSRFWCRFEKCSSFLEQLAYFLSSSCSPPPSARGPAAAPPKLWLLLVEGGA